MEGVDDVAQGLGHLPAVRVPHHAVQVDLPERHLTCTMPTKYPLNTSKSANNLLPHILMLPFKLTESARHSTSSNAHAPCLHHNQRLLLWSCMQAM